MRLQGLHRRAHHKVALPTHSRDHTLTWRELTQGDLAGLAALVARAETSDEAPFRTDETELAEYFAENHEVDAVGGFDTDGELRAFGAVRVVTDGPVRALCSGDVDPAWRERGIGTALVEWQDATGTAMIEQLAPREGGAIVVHVDSTRADTRNVLDRAGFTQEREFAQVRRDLSVAIPEVVLERPLKLEPWNEEWEEQVRRTHNRAFEGSGLAPQYSAEQWRADRAYFVAEWSFVVVDRTTDRMRVAGYLMSSRYAQDWEAQGWTEGTTDLVGVLPAYRGRHVGSAMLSAAMRAYRASGMQYAGMDVDPADATGAYDLAEKLGYETVHRSLAYAKPVPPTRPAR